MWARRQAASRGGRPGYSHRTPRALAGRAGGWGWRRSRRVSPPAPGVRQLGRAGRSRGAGPAVAMRTAASLVEVDWESMPAPAARAAVLLPQERSEAHRPPCSTRRETSRACHPSAPAERARTIIGHTPRAREGVSKQGGTHRPPAAGFTLFDYLDLRAGRKGEVPLGVLRASGGPRVLRDGQLLGLVLHHLGGHGDNAWLVITPGVITPGLTYRRRDWRGHGVARRKQVAPPNAARGGSERRDTCVNAYACHLASQQPYPERARTACCWSQG